MRLSDQPSETSLLGRIERTSLITAVMDSIRRSIESGLLGPGDKLPSERKLQEQLGVGRSTVREALRALDTLGLISLHQGKGAFVRAPSSLPHPGQLQIPELPADWGDLAAVVEARLPIETYAAALAASRRTDEELRALADQLDVFERAMQLADLPRLVLADVEFHFLIADTANTVLAASLNAIGVFLIKSRQLSLSKPERLPHVLDKHRQIYNAIVAKDPARASDAMADHLLDFIKELGFETEVLRPISRSSVSDGIYYVSAKELNNINVSSVKLHGWQDKIEK